MDFFFSKRLFSFVIALLCFSIIVVFMEEYVEDDVQTSYVSGKPGSTPSREKKSQENCWMYEPSSVVDQCVRCSDFEIHALKAKHCVSTGFFDRVNCTQSGFVALRPCKQAVSSQLSSFHVFALLNVIVLPISYFMAGKRIEEANRLAYLRVAQLFETTP